MSVAARPGTAVLSTDLCDFRAALFWQPVESWQIAHKGLEFKMNIETGITLARLISSVDLDKDPDQLRVEMERATHVMPSEDGGEHADFHAVQRRLMNAATWGDLKQLGFILRSCYVTEECALPALGEVCASGHGECVKLLLKAGVSPSKHIPHNPAGKNALHIAVELGQEEIARDLIHAMVDMNEAYVTCFLRNQTAFDILRETDQNGLAKRLEQVVLSKFMSSGYC